MLGQARLAGVDLDVAVDEQRGEGVLLVGEPVAGELVGPGLHGDGLVAELGELAAQGVGSAAAVEAEQAAPFAGLLVAQLLEVAHAG